MSVTFDSAVTPKPPLVGVEMSATITKIAPALVKAQASMGSAHKGANNPFFKSKYADLAEVIETCKDALNESGICFLQPLVSASPTPEWKVPSDLLQLLSPESKLSKEDKEDILAGIFATRQRPRVAICTMLLHESGEWMAFTAEFPAMKEDPQGYFASSTYLRRATLQAALGIPAEDDDGNTAAGRKDTQNPMTKAMTAAFPPDEWLKGNLRELLKPTAPGAPATALIAMPDGTMQFSIFDMKPEYAGLLGRLVEFLYVKQGKFRVIAEMRDPAQMVPPTYTTPSHTLINEPNIPALPSTTPDDETMPIEESDLDLSAEASRYTRGHVAVAKVKTGKKGEFCSLKIETKDETFWANGFGTPGHFGLTEWEEIKGHDIFYLRETDTMGDGKEFHRIVELFPEDVFDQAMLERAGGDA